MLAACAPAAAPEEPTASATPTLLTVNSLAVVGDSISVAASACGSQSPCPDASWALGDSPDVDSIANRLATATGLRPEPVWVARPGATVGGRAEALAPLRSATPDLVLVEIGANDACAPSVADVTSPTDFAAEYAALLSGIRAAAPEARIVAFSIPDLLRLWDVGRSQPKAVSLWNSSPSCRSLLANADSDAPEDVQRRADIDATVDAYNESIGLACADVTDCVFDEGVVHAVQFSLEEISTIDHFHPSIAGQAALAASAWPVVERALQN